MLKLGADEIAIGRITAMMSVGGLILSPLYGYWMDRRGVFFPLIASSLCCSVGCLIRGLAENLTQLYIGAAVLGCGAGGLFTLVLSHISTHSPPTDRSTIVSAYLFQTNALRLLGKGMFPLTNGLLVNVFGFVNDSLLTYRVHMATCTGFCFFGVAWLIRDGKELYQLSQETARQNALERRKKSVAQATGDGSNGSRGSGSSGGGGGGGGSNSNSNSNNNNNNNNNSNRNDDIGSDNAIWWKFGLLALVGATQSAAYTSMSVLWPFYVRQTFQFGALEYSWFLFTAALVCTFSVAVLPVVERRVGRGATASIATLVPCVMGVVAFLPLWGTIESTVGIGVGVACHVLLSVLCFGCLRLAQAAIKSLAPSLVHKKEQGKAFGLLATVVRGGEIVAGLVAPLLYKKSGGATLPLMVVSVVLLVASLLVGSSEVGMHSRSGSGIVDDGGKELDMLNRVINDS
jgi:MFS family permease